MFQGYVRNADDVASFVEPLFRLAMDELGACTVDNLKNEMAYSISQIGNRVAMYLIIYCIKFLDELLTLEKSCSHIMHFLF